jgi:hypothetical protein
VVVWPVMHPCVLALQTSSEVSPVQLAPVVLPQPPVGAGQTQAKVPPDAPQTSPDAAQLVSASCKQLWASAVQAMSVFDWQ